MMPPMKLREMFQKKFDKNFMIEDNWFWLSCNPNAIQLLEQNLDKVNWRGLSHNPNAVHILRENIRKIYWPALCDNPGAISIIEEYPLETLWDSLSRNPNAIHIIEEELDRIASIPIYNYYHETEIDDYVSHNTRTCIDWEGLSINPNALHLLKKNMDKVDYILLLMSNPNPKALDFFLENMERLMPYGYDKTIESIAHMLSSNVCPKAMEILEEYPNEIVWFYLSANPSAIHILEKNLDKIVWSSLSKNPNAIHLLEKYPEKINWVLVWDNPAIFTYDYDAIIRNRPWRDEFYFWVHHPDRISRHVDWGLTDELLIHL